MKKIFKNFISRVANEIMVLAKYKAPVDTANLQGDIRVLKKPTEPHPSAVVGNTAEAKYAKFVHFGTRPHSIEPKNKKILANKKLNKVFGKKVRHPGTKANPYFENALREYANSSEFARAKEALAKDLKTNIKAEILKGFK